MRVHALASQPLRVQRTEPRISYCRQARACVVFARGGSLARSPWQTAWAMSVLQPASSPGTLMLIGEPALTYPYSDPGGTEHVALHTVPTSAGIRDAPAPAGRRSAAAQDASSSTARMASGGCPLSIDLCL